MAASLFRQEGGDDWLSTLSVARIKSSDLTAAANVQLISQSTVIAIFLLH